MRWGEYVRANRMPVLVESLRPYAPLLSADELRDYATSLCWERFHRDVGEIKDGEFNTLVLAVARDLRRKRRW